MMYFILVTTLLLLSVLHTNSLMAQETNRRTDSLTNLLYHEERDTSRVRLLLEIGDEYNIRLSRRDAALTYYKQALNLCRQQRLHTKELAAVNKVASIYNHMGRFTEALEMLLQNLRREEQMKDTTEIFLTKREIMFLYSNIGDQQKKLELSKDLYTFAVSGYFKDPKNVLLYRWMAYNNIGNAYVALGEIDSALYYHTKLYQESRQNSNLELLVIAANRLAEIHFKKGTLDSSFFYSRIGIENAVPADRPDFVKYIHKRLAHAHGKTARMDSAFYYARLALKEHKAATDTAGMMEMALLLSDLFKSQNRFDSAFTYLSYYTALKDKFLSDEKIKQVQTLLFNETMKQKQLEQERKEAQQRYETRVQLYSLLAGLGVLLLLAGILYRNNRQKQKAKLKIESAYKELKATQAQLIQKEKMASLGELTAGIAHEIQNPLNFVNNFSEINSDLLEEMQENINKGDWNETKVIASDVKENNAKIHQHGRRADAIVKGMLQHSRTSKGKKEPADINALADEYLRLSYHGLRAKDKDFNATIETHFDESIGKIEVIPQDIGGVLLNLFNKAFYKVTERKKAPTLTGENYEPKVTVITKRISSPLGAGASYCC
jgi:nitrogen-specific signal transduction histidine kinase